MSKKLETIPSLIKWTGSKRKQASSIQSVLPEYNRYFEPFLGGGAMLYYNSEKESFGNDIYSPLIQFWNMIKENPSFVINVYKNDWEKLQVNFPDYFYEVRDRYNQFHEPTDLAFLSRTCVNGIIRFNDKGEFNNSLHLSRRGMQPEKFAKIVEKWHCKLQKTEFYNEDYEAFLENTQKGDFVYLDPPYAGSKNRYIQNLDIEKLFNVLDRLNSKGVKWALSFDGERGEDNLKYPVPESLYLKSTIISNGNSTLNQVLNKKIDEVKEMLYLNY